MSYPYSDIIFSKEVDRHKYTTYELRYPKEQEEFLKYILPILREEYGFGFNLEEKLNNIDPKRTEVLKKFMAKSMVPDPSIQPPVKQPWLKNTRSKISEVIAKDLLCKLENVKFTCRVSQEEEDPDMPKRGTDNFGFVFKKEEEDFTLESIVTCEVKASDSKKSPPDVVHVNGDSMFNSLKSMASIDKRLIKAIGKSIDKLPEGEYLELVSNIGIDIENGDNLDEIKSKIVVVPFLLRKKQFYTNNDYGKFESHHHEFLSAIIKYYIIAVDYELNDFADEIYSKLREG